MSELASKLFDLREKKSEIKSTLSEVEKELNSVEAELLEEMVQEGMNRIDLQDKAAFNIATRKFFKISDREALIDFLHEQGDVDLLTVNHQTLNAYAKEVLARKEAEGDEDYNIPGVGYTTKTQIRVTKARK